MNRLDTQSTVKATADISRPTVRGRFLFAGDAKLYLRGVTYGTFAPGADGSQFPDHATAERDFAAMAANGLNAVRVYTVPPRWLLDLAAHHGLWVMIGLPWEQHVAFLGDRKRARSIEAGVRAGVRACAGHTAVLCYAVGNEIPASVVRWHGPRAIEHFLERLYRAAKAEDPDGLVTYVNFPTTEYLRLPFLDLAMFNVYLESRASLEGYLARLHNLVDDRPLVMAEIGLDSRRNGAETQATVLDWQLRSALASGCAGAFVFAWTDEWHRGGYDIDDWDFGLTDRARVPKPALTAVRQAFAESPFPAPARPTRFSIVVCSHNGSATIRDCLEGVLTLDYPDFEVIVVDDGSTDGTAAIAGEYGARVISTPNRGLGSARNTGLKAAAGEVIAYLDDDARPDPHWLSYIGAAFEDTEYVAVGGPNVAPEGDGPIADCVAHSPGGPMHVLLNDREAEHIPGCNMAIRRAALLDVGGFDRRFRAAGDDVDVCWRLRDRGGKLGFHAGAVVWHHRRNSVLSYLRQQRGYGKAEALLEGKWPDRYNAGGHVSWAGRLYGNVAGNGVRSRRWRVYYGAWGSGLFQSLYEQRPRTVDFLPLTPEWYLLIAALAALTAIGVLWEPLLALLPVLVAAGTLVIAVSLRDARHAWASRPSLDRSAWRRRVLLTAFLHVAQPLARLIGRVREGLVPWRRRGPGRVALPARRSWTLWSEEWAAPAQRVKDLREAIVHTGAVVCSGGDWDRWDLEIRAGLLGRARVDVMVEEHGAGRQLMRVRSRPRYSRVSLGVTPVLAGLCALAAAGGAWIASALLGAAALALAVAALRDCGWTTGAVVVAMEQSPERFPQAEAQRDGHRRGPARWALWRAFDEGGEP